MLEFLCAWTAAVVFAFIWVVLRYDVAGLAAAARRLRPAPKHLRGRIPAAGEHVTWSPPPDEVGRAEIQRAAALGEDRTWDPATLTLTVRYRMETAAGRAAYRRHLEEQASLRRYVDLGLLIARPEMSVRCR